ncbi:hypothetical protein RRG08_022130 [Elysia crispata]|uniref:Uncharacterized protein n=1 Tax=Elysia crispata TaxID=231223 RepID=A0AAE0Y1G5_9GAST|nr:hypothetical protein RRG08_022130 [Elysia crispata]
MLVVKVQDSEIGAVIISSGFLASMKTAVARSSASPSRNVNTALPGLRPRRQDGSSNVPCVACPVYISGSSEDAKQLE